MKKIFSFLLFFSILPLIHLCNSFIARSILPFYYPIAHTGQLNSPGMISRRFIGEEPLVIYPSQHHHKSSQGGGEKKTRFIVQSDVCPHMGAMLHKGWISPNGGIHCPYHGFEFNENGMFCNIPNPIQKYHRHESLVKLDTFPVYTKFGYLFIPPSIHLPCYSPNPPKKNPLNQNQTLSVLDVPFKPYFPPEAKNPDFRCIQGSRQIGQYQDIVTENLLDMLHISYVHSFGSRLTPIPYDVKYNKIHDWGFRTRFLYCPNQGTISTDVGKVTSVVVENEFYMPSTTITRVTAGNIVKTVHTFTTPGPGKSCTLYWRIYRNFWKDRYFPTFDGIGDVLLRYLMEKTINEDQDILSKIYEDRRNSLFTTKYDVSIRKYRDMIRRFQYSS